MSNFDKTRYSICEFMSEAVIFTDKRETSNFEVVEFVLSQVKTKEYFREL